MNYSIVFTDPLAGAQWGNIVINLAWIIAMVALINVREKRKVCQQ